METFDAPANSISCGPAELGDEAARKACLRRADFLWSQGRLAEAETLLAGLTSEVRCGSAGDAEIEAASVLHFARLVLYGPDNSSLHFTVCAIGGRLNGRGVPAWATLVAWPLAHAHINSGVFEQRIVDVVLHTSRRFMRSKDGANAMLALKAAMRYAAAADNATDKPDELVRRRREYLTPTLAYDAAYIAEWNGWPALRDVYLEAGNRMVESANPDEIERIYDALALYYDENYGFKAPTPVAAMEFFARIARRLPADNEHHKLTTRTWPTLELLYRNDPARAARVAADNLDQYRKQPNADAATIAFLLQSYADAVIESDPEKAWAARREALEALSKAPGLGIESHRAAV